MSKTVAGIGCLMVSFFFFLKFAIIGGIIYIIYWLITNPEAINDWWHKLTA